MYICIYIYIHTYILAQHHPPSLFSPVSPVLLMFFFLQLRAEITKRIHYNRLLPLTAATSFEHRGPQCLLILTRSTSPPLDQSLCVCARVPFVL